MRILVLVSGILLLTGLSTLCIQQIVPAIESELKIKTEAALDEADLKWATVHISGQNVELSGVAPSAKARDLALQKVAAITGVEKTEDQIHIKKTIAAPSPYEFVLKYHQASNELILDGYTPTEPMHVRIVEKLRQQWPDAQLSDRLRISHGAPENMEILLTQVLIPKLAAAKDVTATLLDNKLYIHGDATAMATQQPIQQALRYEDLDNYQLNPPNLGQPTVITAAPEQNPPATSQYVKVAAITETKPQLSNEANKNEPMEKTPAKEKAGQTEESAIETKEKAIQGCQEQLRFLNRKNSITFDVNSTKISKESYSVLDEIADVIKQCEKTPIRIEGHTDSSGRAQANKTLSEKRAHAVRQYLVRKGIPAIQLSAKGFGEENPISPNDTPENRAKNRRIEFKIVQD